MGVCNPPGGIENIYLVKITSIKKGLNLSVTPPPPPASTSGHSPDLTPVLLPLVTWLVFTLGELPGQVAWVRPPLLPIGVGVRGWVGVYVGGWGVAWRVRPT